jgi:hypothetical protein
MGPKNDGGGIYRSTKLSADICVKHEAPVKFTA